MGPLQDRLMTEVKKIFAEQWQEVTTQSVPEPTDLLLNSNYAKEIESATVLYADLDGSTNMVDSKFWGFSAEIYKTYLQCASQIIRDAGGSITSYDGDRVMAIFTGDTKNTTAVKCALKINGAIHDIIRPAMKAQYPAETFTINHVVGIDTSALRAARIGIRRDNDIVWIGRAANYAAKLTSVPGGPLWITGEVYDVMMDEVKYLNGTSMWSPFAWNPMNKMRIFSSTYKWTGF